MNRVWLLTASVLAFACSQVAANDGSLLVDDNELIKKGEQIYRDACQRCHGSEGQGSEDEYDDPLIGDMTVGELAEQIAETMPEEDPDSCKGPDSVAVATYIHYSFYSEAARIRNRPPRVSLARLTAEQLRQSYADLYGHFNSDPWIENNRGAKAIYFDGARWRNDKKKIERVDPVIEFDFGNEGPGEEINPKAFYIHWTGSLKVDQTGRYDIILRSSCSCVMTFGELERELFNNHVQSEGREEFRKTLHLTAGRAYPFKIDFIQRERKTEQPPAKISLSWVPPGRDEEVVPSRNLIPAAFPPTFALQAKLPPDDSSYGYERGTAIDRAWDESTTQAAIEFGQIAVDELFPRFKRRDKSKPRTRRSRDRLEEFLQALVETAFRGPLDEPTKQLYIDRQLEKTEDDAEAIKRVVLITLKSPRFLYPSLASEGSDSRRAANQLALVLHDSLPSDQWLTKKVEKDQLQNEKQVADAARRMVGDFRTRGKVRAFLHHWLELSGNDEIIKDEEIYAGFDSALVGDLRASLDAFLDQVVWSESSDFRQLLQADWMFTSERMESFYGEAWKSREEPAEATEDGSLAASVADPQVHVGVLTHPLILSELGYYKTSSPIHRGIFLNRKVLGRVIRPPTAAFTPLNPDLHPKLTTRQRVQLQTGEVNCQVCHAKINSLGFALEGFDGAGRFRTSENEQPIDASGSYVNRLGEPVDFNGARELGDYLAGSDDCHRAFVEAAFEHFVKQPIAAYGTEATEQLTTKFQESGFNIRELVVSIAVMVATQSPTENPQT